MNPEMRLAKLIEAVEAQMRQTDAAPASAEAKYRHAMIERALALTRRALEGGVDAPERALNLALLGREEASLARLAERIRARALDDRARSDLHARLLDYVRARAARWNPDLVGR